MTIWTSSARTMVAAAILLPACASRGSAPISSSPSAIDVPDQPGLTVVLVWDAPADLDLYVTDPSWETVYFANTPSRSGAELTQDVRCDDVTAAGPFVEVVRIADPLIGGYRIGVDFIERCSGEDTLVSFRVIASTQGALPMETSDTIELERFRSHVAEYRFDGTALIPARADRGDDTMRRER